MEFIKGDMVSSVGGEFISGVVEEVEKQGTMELLTIRWLRHISKGDIDFVQKRSSHITRKIR